MRIKYEQMILRLRSILLKYSFPSENAELVAKIFSDSTLDGYHSHGINRFGEFIKNVEKGIIDPQASPTLVEKIGPLERYDGQQGPGPVNAHFCMQRAIDLAKKKIMSCVSLRNTNHWMRGGTYGWMAAEKNCISICFTNTMPNMPPWGGTTTTTGNNPIVVAVPRTGGPVILDMSLSQFSYGKLYRERLGGKQLPLPGGFDHEGNLTTDPDAIIKSKRILQTGYWKGSGLSLLIDMMATLLSDGSSTSEIGKLDAETNLSQVFMCIDVNRLGTKDKMDTVCDEIIRFYKSSIAQQQDHPVRYPGEATLERRREQLKSGIEVDNQIWESIDRL